MENPNLPSEQNERAERKFAEPASHTPGPWDYVPSTEHHGPYVTSNFGSTICDCYVMSEPGAFSVRNGGTSRPISFMHEMADPNARLIAAAPRLLKALEDLVRCCEQHRAFTNPKNVITIARMESARAAIAKATAP